ncbi:hypothetical protein [Gordonia soli]|uniref:hypothetical protein n=1 Tax=Gordonia soli TaxID=320799 RepID=UPI0012F7F443|nr:hypothetical protein [Gordonia soli]
MTSDWNRWSSLEHDRELATHLLGDRGSRVLAEWLDTQRDVVDDTGFGATFSDHIAWPGAATIDFTHRLLTTRRGRLLGGIRFYNRNLSRPFVEVIAHTFDDLTHLVDCVAHEWSLFRPRHLRLRTEPASGDRFPSALPDVSILGARHGEIAAPAAGVRLEEFDDIDDACRIIADAREVLEAAQPDLAESMHHSGLQQLVEWHEATFLHAIVVDKSIVGALAVAPGSVDWITGDVVTDEAVHSSARGHGFAAAARRLWAHRFAGDRDRLLIGAIDHRNTASSRTARNAGREVLSDRIFVPLDV